MAEKKLPPTRRKRDELLEDLRRAEERIKALEQENINLASRGTETFEDVLVPFTTRIPRSVRERINETARLNRTSVQVVSTIALRRALWNMENLDEFDPETDSDSRFMFLTKKERLSTVEL